MSTAPVQHQSFINLLEHLGEVGIEKAGEFADGIGSVVNALAPGTQLGTAVASLIKAVASAQAEVGKIGDDQKASGSRKLSIALGLASPPVSKALQAAGRPSGTAEVTQVVEQTVSALKTIPVTAGSTKVSGSNQAVSDKQVSVDPSTTSQAPQQAPKPAPTKS